MKISKAGIIALGVLLLLLPVLAACGGGNKSATPTQTPQPTQTAKPTPEASVAPGLSAYRNPAFPGGYQNPLAHLPFPQDPFLAPNGKSNMHCDAYMSDTYEVSGPLGLNPQVSITSYAATTNLCVTIAFDSKGRIITTNARPDAFYLLLIDPNTLDELASYPLPPRHTKDPLYPYRDTSGGAYFVLDNQDRVLVADSNNVLQVVKYVDAKGKFELVQKYDLSDYVVPMTLPAMDHVQMAMPDWNGLLWFTTRYGKVGTIDPQSSKVHTLELTGEEIQNSFTVGEDGVYIITDHAMYRFHAAEDGTPVQDWRTEYDRGSRIKPSMINQGSGTTPQLFGDMVAIGDNADPRMHIIFLKRSDGSEVCQLPVFADNQSTTENALPGFVREGPNGLEYSVIVENNYGKLSDNLLKPGGCCAENVGGISRIDLIPDKNGKYSCREIWMSTEDSCSTVPKLSLGNGLLYLYTYEKLPQNDPPDDFGYYLTAVDFATGKTVFRIPTGTGVRYTDFGAPITLGPAGGTVYIGNMGGLVKIKDSAP